MKKPLKFTIGGDKDYILAIKKASREEEIEKYGKLISTRPTKVHKSKKCYNRKSQKTNDGTDFASI